MEWKWDMAAMLDDIDGPLPFLKKNMATMLDDTHGP